MTATDALGSHHRRSNTTLLTPAFALGLAALGLWFRVMILRSPIGYLNSDEVVGGIMGDQILHGHLPVVYAGNPYGGTTESFLFAFTSWLPLSRAVVLKSVSVFFWALASWFTARTAKLIISPTAALAAGLSVWLASGAATLLSTQAYAGYPSGIAYVAGTLYLLAVGIGVPVERQRRRLLVEFSAGLLMGLAVWSHPMFLSPLLPAGLVYLAHRVRVSRLLPWAVGVGALTSIAPYLIWNWKHHWVAFHGVPPPVKSTYFGRLRGFGTQLIPRGLGLRTLAGRWIGGGAGKVVYLLVAVLAVVGVAILWRRKRAARMIAVSCAGVFPLMALFPNLAFVNDGRYFVNVAALWPFAVLTPFVVVSERMATLRRQAAPIALSSVLVLGLVLNVSFLHSIGAGRSIDGNAAAENVADVMRAEGHFWVHGSYWIVLRLMFFSEEQISTRSTDTGQRFPSATARVDTQPPESVSFVFQTSTDDPSKLALPVSSYDRRVFGDLVLYTPKAHSEV